MEDWKLILGKTVSLAILGQRREIAITLRLEITTERVSFMLRLSSNLLSELLGGTASSLTYVGDGGFSDASSEHAKAGPSSRPYPLQLDTALTAKPVITDNNSPASSTYVDHISPAAPSPRRSSESTRTMPRPAALRRERTVQDRSRSMSAMTSQAQAMLSDLQQYARPAIPVLPPVNGDRSSTTSPLVPSSRRTPIVYPALLSRVAEAFRVRVPLTERAKDGLSYKEAFDGREAVDKIAYIIKTTDRNLALLLGRALDAQKFFHDVTYDHRLRDSPHELYQFRTKLPSPFVSGELANGEANAIGKALERPALSATSSGDTTAIGTPADDVLVNPQTRPRSGSASSDDIPLPSGVFTLLTDCYSPTCSRDSLCYSIACPRRLEQQARLNMKPQPGLKRSISRESLGDLVVGIFRSLSVYKQN